MQIWPGSLSFEQVDPERHPFDDGEVEALVTPLIPLRKKGAGVDWENAITDRLVERFGSWASGWRWAADEGSIGGGPVHAWCCPPHSLSTPAETAARVRAALREWRVWIERLTARFAELAPANNEPTVVAEAFERAVVLLVNDVVEQTNAGDAWYAHCAQVLGWYLERLGVPRDDASALIENAISGRFQSWVGPDGTVTQDVAIQIAASAVTRRNA